MGQYLTHNWGALDPYDLQSRLEANEERLRSMREKLTRLQMIILQGPLTSTNEQDKDKVALRGTEEQSMLREEETHVTDLPSLSETKDLRITKTRERWRELQVQKELSSEEKQRVIELLQSQLATYKKEIATMREQLNKFQGQEEQLRDKQQRVTKLKRQLKANEQELTRMGGKSNEYQGQREQLREEQQRNTELQCRLETNEHEMIAMREQLNEFQGNKKQLRGEQQRVTVEVTELQSQLETNEQELATMRGQLNEYKAQKEQLKEEQQRNTELQRRLKTNEHEMIRMREQLNEFQGQKELLRVEQQRVTELQRLLEAQQHEMTTIRDQQREIKQNEKPAAYEDPRDWVIYRYEILKTQELGRGAWGIVYQGKFHGCDVAVKEMHEALIDSDYNRYLFEREVEIASRCRHPCLLQFIGATSDERPLLVTEIMECSLRARLYNADEKTLSTAEASVISLDVARALNYLHQKHEPIIHHDISSANVLLWRQGNQWRAKVSDYGTANFVRQSNINYAGAVIYCAPESLNKDPDQPISCKVDVYSFGVLLCEMCIRQQPNPQQRENQISRMRNHKFKNVVRRCVTREPWERPNMESIIEELEKPAPSCS